MDFVKQQCFADNGEFSHYLYLDAVTGVDIDEDVLIEALKAEVERLTHDSKKFYHANGAWGIYPTPEEVIAKRIAAAKEVKRLRERLSQIDGFGHMTKTVLYNTLVHTKDTLEVMELAGAFKGNLLDQKIIENELAMIKQALNKEG